MGKRLLSTIGVLATVASFAHGQAPAPQPVEIPPTATLQGVPTVRIDSTEASTTRRVLAPAEAAKTPLTVRVRDGQYVWASRGDQPLHAYASGAYTYLTSSEPGRYIRLTRLKDKITYVEHVDNKEFGSITWWGELRIVLGR
jgi:hypothetical protein